MEETAIHLSTKKFYLYYISQNKLSLKISLSVCFISSVHSEVGVQTCKIKFQKDLWLNGVILKLIVPRHLRSLR